MSYDKTNPTHVGLVKFFRECGMKAYLQGRRTTDNPLLVLDCNGVGRECACAWADGWRDAANGRRIDVLKRLKGPKNRG